MVRDFIRDRLYASSEGYFQKEDHQVGQLSEPIEFGQLLGYHAYRQQFEQRYPQNAWITPSEVFKPYFGYMVGNYIIENWYQNKYKNIRIVEIGPGTGVLAESIIEYLKMNAVQRRINFDYHLVEISESLCKNIEQRMEDSFPSLIKNEQIKVFNKSILEYDISTKVPTFVIGMEILDNMPHDRLYKESEDVKEPWKYQTTVELNKEGGEEFLQENIEEINDEWCQLYLDLHSRIPKMDNIDLAKEMDKLGIFPKLSDMWRSLTGRRPLKDNIFIPTETLRLFKHVNTIMPSHHLVLADFDSFIMPRKSVNGINAPLVTNKLAGPSEWESHDTYLIDQGVADICFPSDFYYLRHSYELVTGKKASHMKNYEMFDKFAVSNWCETQNGFNPMKEEYVNTSFLLS
ncbi:unnamed protein product [Moneuplotes crassus]|uniref:Protein arginine methyltransferase NDUFAF7 n=1 Tax=Euplotes crassus TaxID=5936 RepID=A0AAD1UML1_EUPCR|nr:unnamed protein product [Moneuplotes crassus]